MATAVVMPKLGNTVESSIILSWKKQPGDDVAAGDILCEVETDKAVMEVESPAAGTLLGTFFDEGDEVPVMVNIAAIGDPGEDYTALRPDGASDAALAPETAPQPEVITPSAQPQSPAAPTASTDSTRISPRARNLAARKTLDTSAIEGTGPKGRIIERDVIAALHSQPRMTPVARSMVAQGDFIAPERGSGPGGRITKHDLLPTAPVASASAPADDVTRIPLKGVRKVIADRMRQSLQTTAQLTLNTSADARALQGYRQRLKASDASLGLTSITIGDLVNYAIARTLPTYPELNALFTDDTISQYGTVHLGFAVDTPRGLVVPVIHNASALSLKQLADEAHRLTEAALSGSLTPDEMSGGTFTVSNLGAFGIEHFTPVLNAPQVGILGVSNIDLKPVSAGGGVEFIPHLGLSLTIDHQAVDGAPGARFLQALARNIAAIDLLVAL